MQCTYLFFRGLRSNNRYKIQVNVNNSSGECSSKICKEFKTAKHSKTNKAIEMHRSQRFNVPKMGKSDRFLIKNDGKTVMLNGYDSGCCIFGNYVKCNGQHTVSSVRIKLTNICSSGFGLGFATENFVDFDGWNTGQDGSVMIYGNSEFYTSEEFMNENEEYNSKNGSKLFNTDFMKKNDAMVVTIDNKFKKLQIVNRIRNKKVELNWNEQIKSVAIILWMGWTNGQSVTIINDKYQQ